MIRKIRLAADRMRLEVHHPLVYGATDDLRRSVTTAIETGHKIVEVDLAHCGKVDCRGLGQLIESYAEAGHAGAKLCLRGLRRDAVELLLAVKLYTVFGPGACRKLMRAA